jgi:adenosylmethionine-8-amino-7-oxononanoate aminotransferase
MTRRAYPESRVFYRKLKGEFPCIVRGEGIYLFDDSGRRYLDGSGGAFVANLGHGLGEAASPIARQAGEVGYLNGTAFTHPAAEQLAAEISELCPGDLRYVYFLTSGSEAVEAALKLARQYFAETGRPQKRKILALSPGYHGNTLLALSASAREHYKTFFGGWLVDVPRVPAPYAYRCSCRGRDPGCPACSGAALEEAIDREGAETVCAFIAEPVGGSSTGASVPGAGYWRRVREICDRREVLWIADEVLTGAGRTGTWSAQEPYGACADIMTLGKGIAGGFAPLSAVVAPRRLLDPIARGSGALLHAQTFSHNPTLCAAGLAALRAIKERGLIGRCAAMGEVFHRRLRESLLPLDHVGDVRGRGLLAGVEFVEDKESRAPFPRKLQFAETFFRVARDCGLVVWPNSGQAPGGQGDIAMLAPPFIITEEQISELVSLFKVSLDRTLETLKPQSRKQ